MQVCIKSSRMRTGLCHQVFIYVYNIFSEMTFSLHHKKWQFCSSSKYDEIAFGDELIQCSKCE